MPYNATVILESLLQSRGAVLSPSLTQNYQTPADVIY